MDLIFSIVGLLGLGAFVIAIFVFATAAKRYVTGDEPRNEPATQGQRGQPGQKPASKQTRARRTEYDRRQARAPATFPLVVAGEIIEADRRSGRDRRSVG